MMRSATAFLPPSMITFMNLDSSTLPNLGSGRISRLGTSRRRGIFYLYLASVGTISGTARAIRTPTYSTRANDFAGGSLRCIFRATRLTQHRKPTKAELLGLRTLGTVLGTGLLTVLDALQVKRAAHDVVTHTGQILHTATAQQHD